MSITVNKEGDQQKKDKLALLEEKHGALASLVPDLSPADIELLYRSGNIPHGAPAPIVGLWLKQHAAMGLSPFLNHLKLVVFNQRVKGKNGQPDTWEEVYQTITTLDAMRTIAERTGKRAGMDPVLFNATQVWDSQLERYRFEGLTESQLKKHALQELKLNPGKQPNYYPESATACLWVWSQGQRVPYYGEALWESFYPGDNAKGAMWRRFYALMLGKCAKAQAYREAFPDLLAGVYIEEEMHQAQAEVDPMAERTVVDPSDRYSYADIVDELRMLVESEKVTNTQQLMAHWESLPFMAKMDDSVQDLFNNQANEFSRQLRERKALKEESQKHEQHPTTDESGGGHA